MIKTEISNQNMRKLVENFETLITLTLLVLIFEEIKFKGEQLLNLTILNATLREKSYFCWNL